MSIHNSTIIDELSQISNEQSWQLLRCARSKAPLDEHWQTKRITRQEALQAPLLGLVPATAGFVVVDVDTDHSEPVDNLCEAVEESLGAPACVITTPSGGKHLYYRKGSETIPNSAWKLRGERGGEIRADNGFVVLWDISAFLGAIEHIDDYTSVDHSLWPLTEQTLFNAPPTQARGTRRGRRPGEERVRKWLNLIDADVEYETWIKVGMSLHREGYSISVWEDWSAQGKKYKEGECAHKWVTFNENKDNAVGMRWLENLVIEHGPQWVDITQRRNPSTRSPDNVSVAIDLMPEEFTYNEFTHQEFIDDDPIEDHHVRKLRSEIAKSYQFTPSQDAMHEGVSLLCEDNRFHPVRDYLEVCKENWDGRLRLNRAGHTYWSTEDTPLQNHIARIIIMGMVARIVCPGAKYDYMPVIHSHKQGTGKSTSCAILGGQWASDGFYLDKHDLSKVALERTDGVWLMECAEIGGFSGADTEKLKGFITTTSDDARLAFGRKTTRRKRQFILVGTTNQGEFLPDIENRRFPILEVKGMVDLVALERDRDQLFGEAMHELRHYPDYHIALNENLWDAQEHGSDSFRRVSDFETFFLDWLERQTNISPLPCADLQREQPSGTNDQEKARVLQRYGYRRLKRTVGAKRTWCWVKA